MNKRIRELCSQAISDVDGIQNPDTQNMYIPDCFAEKFAELIVQECAMKANAVAIDLRNDRDLDARKYVGNSILKALGS